MHDHWPLFTEFVRAETAAGGPDPQIPLIVELAKERESLVEKVWLAGCYGAHHCIPSAYVVWSHWRPEVVLHKPDELESWLRAFWAGLPVRPEMKSHRMPEKRRQCLVDFARYAVEERWRVTKDYEAFWISTQQEIKYYGRYMAIKYLELLRELVRPDIAAPDIRARGAWSPRRTLSWLFPEEPRLAQQEDKSQEAEQLVERVALQAKERLAASGLPLHFFQLQVLLCEYREALAGGFYPGGTHDEELDYMALTEKVFGREAIEPIFQARRRLFPEVYLGEVGGWSGLRREKFQAFKGGANV